MTSSLSNVAVIRTNDEDDAVPPGYVLDLQALTPSNIPQPIGNLITVDEEDLSLVVDGDLATVWQPASTVMYSPQPSSCPSLRSLAQLSFQPRRV